MFLALKNQKRLLFVVLILFYVTNDSKNIISTGDRHRNDVIRRNSQTFTPKQGIERATGIRLIIDVKYDGLHYIIKEYAEIFKLRGHS